MPEEKGKENNQEKYIPAKGARYWKRGGLGGGGGNDDAVFHRIVLFQGFDELGHGRTLLANSDVDAVELELLIVAVVPSLLVQHGIKRNSSLSGLTITDDQLTLTTTNWHHGIDRFETGLDWLVDGSTGQNTRSLDLSTGASRGFDGALAIDGVTKSINNTTKHSLADRNIDLNGVSSAQQHLLGLILRSGRFA